MASNNRNATLFSPASRSKLLFQRTVYNDVNQLNVKFLSHCNELLSIALLKVGCVNNGALTKLKLHPCATKHFIPDVQLVGLNTEIAKQFGTDAVAAHNFGLRKVARRDRALTRPSGSNH